MYKSVEKLAMLHVGLLNLNLPQLSAMRDMNFILVRNTMIHLCVTGYQMTFLENDKVR